VGMVNPCFVIYTWKNHNTGKIVKHDHSPWSTVFHARFVAVGKQVFPAGADTVLFVLGPNFQAHSVSGLKGGVMRPRQTSPISRQIKPSEKENPQ